jgi:hypothetical protein
LEEPAAQGTVSEERREMEQEEVVEYEMFGGKRMKKGRRMDVGARPQPLMQGPAKPRASKLGIANNRAATSAISPQKST